MWSRTRDILARDWIVAERSSWNLRQAWQEADAPVHCNVGGWKSGDR